jgi:3-oxoacyl-[acyl-carrier-protein] synthase-1
MTQGGTQGSALGGAAAVIGVGVCSSLGLDAESSLAAAEAGLSRMVETSAFGTGDTVAVCAPLELLPLDTARGRRIHWLAGTAYLDLMRRFPEWKRVDLPVLLVGPESCADHDVPRDFMITNLRELGDAAVPRPASFGHSPPLAVPASFGHSPPLAVPAVDWWLAGGRGGWFAAANRALALLAAGEPLVALAAVDSDCDPNSLLRLARRKALLGKDNQQGRIPGEGAAFVLLARPDVVRQIRARALAWLGGIHTGAEPRHLLQPRSSTAEGLTRVFAQLRDAHPDWRADAVYSSQPGTNHWGREFKLAALRNASLLPEPMNYLSLHGELGDCGSASAPMQLAFAVLRFERGDALRRVLIYGESDDGALGACLVEPAQEATNK